MSASEMIAIEIRGLPAPSRLERQVDRLPMRRIGWVGQAVLGRMAFGRRWDDLRRNFSQAKAELLLVAPVEMIGLVLRVEDHIAAWDQRKNI